MIAIYPAGAVRSLVVLLLLANTLNIAADIAGMGDSTELRNAGASARLLRD